MYFIIFGIILFIMLLLGIVLLFCYLREKKYNKFIDQNSCSLKRLIEINHNYQFSPLINLNQEHIYDNENFYDTISCQDYLIYQLQFVRYKVINQIKTAKQNKQLYDKYLSAVKKAIHYGEFDASVENLNCKKLLEKEKNILMKHFIKEPQTEFSLTVCLYCSRLNGDVYKRKQATFSAEEIFRLVKRLDNKNGTYYNDKEIWNALCRVERGKVSNKMRFAIYERDGYKCCKCGTSHRYAYLEIDHIIPISKGGKSTYDNLQTLCHRCNYEKSDRLE